MKNFLASIFLILIGIIFFTATLRGVWGNPNSSQIKDNLDQATKPLELSPERGRFILTENLYLNKSFALSKSLADAASPDVGYYKGNYFIFFAPGISIMSLPLYYLGLFFNLSQVFSFSTITIFSVLNLIVIFFICRHILKFPMWASILPSLIFGFGSVAWSYSGTLYQHQATVFFILSAFYAVWRYKKHERWGFIWAGYAWLSYGLAILIDYPNILLMSPVMVYLFLSSVKIFKKDDKFKVSFRLAFLVSSTIFIIVSLAHAYYNNYYYGGYAKLSGGLVGYKTIKEQKLDQGNIDDNIKRINEIGKKKNPVKFFKEDNLLKSSEILFIAPDKGIFIFNPIFIIGFLGALYVLKKKNIEENVLLSVVIVNLFLYSSWGDPWGGWAFGPRYLIPTVSVLSIFISVFLLNFKYKFSAKIIVFLLFVFSAGVSLLGALTTNAVPPKVEAVYLKMKYGFAYNLDFLKNDQSSSFLFNNYFKNYLNLTEYYSAILFLVSLIFFIVIFILPYLGEEKE